MDFAKAFKFVFDDPDWLKKIGVMALITLIPVVGSIVLMGYALETAQRVIRQDADALPNLDFGAQLGLGFKGVLIGLVYAIPIFIFEVPPILGTTLLANSNSNSDNVSSLIGILFFCCYGLIFLYALGMAFVLPAAIGNFLATGELSAAFHFSEVFGLIRAAPGAYVMVLLGGIAANFIASLGMIACFVGILFTFPYAIVVTYHLYGQAYRAAIANGGLRY